MWDLTVPGPHDFYVQAAATAVLVHNCPTYDEALAQVENVDVSTAPNKAVFYSNAAAGNRARAIAFAQKIGGTTLEQTPGGQWLESLDPYNLYGPARADALWTRLSERYAQGASGEINAFIRDYNPARVWAQTEWDTLKANPDVYSYRLHY